MSTKSKEKIRISFPSNSSEGVAGSQVLIECGKSKKTILVECGLIQENVSLLKQYQLNTKKFAFKPKNLDYVICLHTHADHIGLVPRLYKEGCKANIIMPTGNKKIMREMLLDSAKIMDRDAQFLTRKFKKEYSPIYANEDVYRAIEYVKEYERNIKIELDEDITIEFISSGHIINSCQAVLWVKNGSQIKKIVITSDLGNIKLEQSYVDKFEPIQNANLLIGETTYCNIKRSIKEKDREKDLEKIRSVILTTCVDQKGSVLIPVFALQRCQQMLTYLYDIFYEDSLKGNFNLPVYLSSPLASKICNLFIEELRDEEQREKWKKVLSWKNLIIVKDFEELESKMREDKPAVYCASAGMMNAGHSVYIASQLLPKSKNCILFCGYMAEGSLGAKIKSKSTKTVTIDGKPVPARCNIISLVSMSSHMQHDELLWYYSTFNFDKIALVHGEFKDKLSFSKELQEEISKKNKTGKVTCVNKSTEILL